MQTVAVIGATEDVGPAIVNELAGRGYRLLLISDNNNQIEILTNRIRQSNSYTIVEMISCAKEGCWEADMILLVGRLHNEVELAEKIGEVAVGKIIVSVNPDGVNGAGEVYFEGLSKRGAAIRELLPNSNCVEVYGNESPEGFDVKIMSGKDMDTLKTVQMVLSAVC